MLKSFLSMMESLLKNGVVYDYDYYHFTAQLLLEVHSAAEFQFADDLAVVGSYI